MDSHFSRVSDEELFLLMSEGDKLAQDILLKRYVHLGRQIAGVFIRQKGLKNVTDQDFIEVIYESVFKAFSYYQPNRQPFFLFCRDILNQNLYRATDNQIIENIKQMENIQLDDRIQRDSDALNHEIIYDNSQHSLTEQYSINEVIMNLSSSNSLELKTIAKIYLLHEMGYTIEEIMRETNTSSYQVRRVIADPAKALKDGRIKIKLK